MIWENNLVKLAEQKTEECLSRKTADLTSTSRLNDIPMSIDDISFCDDNSNDENRDHLHNNNRPLSPMCTDRLLSPEPSPQRFEIVPRRKFCLSSQKELIFDKLQIIDGDNENSVTPSTSNCCSSSSSSSFSSRMIASVDRNNHHLRILSPVKNVRTFISVGSETMNDDSMDHYDMLQPLENHQNQIQNQNQNRQPFCDETNLPYHINSLISGNINVKAVTPEMKRPSVRRFLLDSNSQQLRLCTSLFEPKTPEILRISESNVLNNSTTTTRTTSNSTTTTNVSPSKIPHLYCFKRCDRDPPSISSTPIKSKRFCSVNEKENDKNCNQIFNTNSNLISQSISPKNLQKRVTFSIRPPLRNCISVNDTDIMNALARCDNNSGEPELIGDFSKPFCLPIIDGNHRDLKSISSDTVAKLINGDFNYCIDKFAIIDCRYPYEYEGGHIRGAKNLYTQEQIIEEFIKNKTDAITATTTTLTNTANDEPKRNILVFHCEFSSKRGPKLSRFLRSNDRESNTNSYPILDYPEIYLLHNGYKEFYEKYSELCDPSAYRPMLEPAYSEAYKYFRSKSKTWNGGDSKGIMSRLKKSRSRLVL